MNKQELASKIWESANKMRSKIEAHEYKDYILGFIFYKFLSDKEISFLKENDWKDDDLKQLTEDDTEIVQFIQKNLGYFIAYKDLFSTWVKPNGERETPFIAANVSDALNAFNRLVDPSSKQLFENIFYTLETGLTKLGETSNARTKAIKNLLDLIKEIPMDGKQDYDVLGFIYEYLINNFAANAGKKAGEFYTPHEVSLVMSEIVANHLKDRSEIKIYDPTSGSGSLLINIGKCAAKYMGVQDRIKYYAQELKENTYNLTRMNLIMRGILPNNIMTRCGDTLEEDWPSADISGEKATYEPLYVDAVVSNPPYSQSWDPKGKENDPRYLRFGLAPRTKADYAFLLHDLYHLKPDGIMTIVLPHGVLFRSGDEGKIRKNLIEQNHIDTIIGLPANIFFGTGIPTIILVLKQKRNNNDILFIDASKGFEKIGKNNKLRARDIKRIVDVVTLRKSVENYSRLVSRDEIRRNSYNLNIPRYVDTSEKSESWDIFSLMFGGIPVSELEELDNYWNELPGLKSSLFVTNDYKYYQLVSTDIRQTILNHPSVTSFFKNYRNSFNNFYEVLEKELVVDPENIIIAQEESKLGLLLSSKLENIPLVDYYDAFQILDDNWAKIAIDLEIIQTEGLNAVKTVDPHIVTKKVKGRYTEVQEGWEGHIFPFDLVQKRFLNDDLIKLQASENALATLVAERTAYLDDLSEEDKDRNFVNDARDTFVEAEVKKAIKEMTVESSTLSILQQVARIFGEEKNLKKKIKTEKANLHDKTKTLIENLVEDQIRELLSLKWIVPFVDQINALPEKMISELIHEIEYRENKYKVTQIDIDKKIKETERSLIPMLNDLTGNEFDILGIQTLKKLLEE